MGEIKLKRRTPRGLIEYHFKHIEAQIISLYLTFKTYESEFKDEEKNRALKLFHAIDFEGFKNNAG